ncbi:MAG: alpha/beta fold hydrolase [Actinomycetota bacterium]
MERVRTADGFEIPFVVEGDDGGQGLVFAHGLMGTGAAQRLQLAPLVETGWKVVTFDQRGHGGATPVTDAAGYDPIAMGGDLWTVADAAGLDRCWIGGGSMGAATSFCAARSKPERVEGLVQCIPALRDEAHPMVFGFDAIAGVLHDGGIEGLIAALRQFATSMGRDESDEVFLSELKSHDPASLELALRNVPRWILDDVPSAFADLPFRVVVFGWDNDPIHPLQTAKDMAASARVDLIELDSVEAFTDRTLLGRLLHDALEKAPA